MFSRADLGVLVEYHYDSRGEISPAPFDNDLFAGARLAFNDVQSSEALFGFIVDLHNASKILFLEESRRMGESYTLEIEYRGFVSVDRQDVLYLVSRDDHLLVRLAGSSETYSSCNAAGMRNQAASQNHTTKASFVRIILRIVSPEETPLNSPRSVPSSLRAYKPFSNQQ